MEDATKATARNLFDDAWTEGAPEREGLSAPQQLEPEIPTDEKAHERWFLEQRGSGWKFRTRFRLVLVAR